jgi:hypothetical protein
MGPFSRAEYLVELDAVAERLGRTRYAELLAQGKAMTDEEAVRVARARTLGDGPAA